MTTLTTQRINDLLEQRETLTNRRDEHIDFAAVDAIDTQLATVPAGVNNILDLRLGRTGAVLPERAEYQMRPATDTAAATEAIAELAQKKQSDHDAYLESIADQYADMLDWHRLCGDLAL